MTLKEAIEILTFQVKLYNEIHQQDTIDALKLGIEALRRLGQYRNWQPPSDIQLLPGETKD